jgi:hypothetical protein
MGRLLHVEDLMLSTPPTKTLDDGRRVIDSDLNHPSYFKRLDKLLASHSTKPCSFIGLSSFNIVP